MEHAAFPAFSPQGRYSAGSHFINPVCGHFSCLYTVSHHHCSHCGFGTTEVGQLKGHSCQRSYGSELPPPTAAFYQPPPPAGFYPPPPLRHEDREYAADYVSRPFFPTAPMLGAQYFPPPPPGAPGTFYSPVYRTPDPLLPPPAPLDFSERRPTCPTSSSRHHQLSSERTQQGASSATSSLTSHQPSAFYSPSIWLPPAQAREVYMTPRNAGDFRAQGHGEGAEQDRSYCAGWPPSDYVERYGGMEAALGATSRELSACWLPPAERQEADRDGAVQTERPSCQLQQRAAAAAQPLQPAAAAPLLLERAITPSQRAGVNPQQQERAAVHPAFLERTAAPVQQQEQTLEPPQLQKTQEMLPTPDAAAIVDVVSPGEPPPAPPTTVTMLPPAGSGDSVIAESNCDTFLAGKSVEGEFFQAAVAGAPAVPVSGVDAPALETATSGCLEKSAAVPETEFDNGPVGAGQVGSDREKLIVTATAASGGNDRTTDMAADQTSCQKVPASQYQEHSALVVTENEASSSHDTDEMDDEHVDSPAALPPPQKVDSSSAVVDEQSMRSSSSSTTAGDAVSDGSSGGDTSLSPINVEIQVNCLICSTLINLQVDQYCDIYLDNIATAHSRLPVSEKLGLVLRYHFSPELLHSHTLCRRCFNIINGIDQLEGRLEKLRTEVRQKFAGTCADRGLSGDHFPSREPEAASVAAAAPSVPTLDRSVQTSPPPDPWRCSVCAATFRYRSDLKRHARSHGGARAALACGRCARLFGSRDALRRHRARAHAAGVKCGLCRRVLDSRAALLAHVCAIKGAADAEANAARTCKTCGKVFTQKRNLVAHRKRCGDREEFTCETCHARVLGRINYEKHVLKHERSHPHVCATCRKGFHKPSDLRRHERTHEKAKSHVCETCGKQFSTTSNYNQHMAKIHLSTKTFACSVCPRTFSYKSSLDIHMKRHNGEKSFKCDQCAKEFLYKNNLARHLKLHGARQEYKCENCDTLFAKSTALKEHLLTCF